MFRRSRAVVIDWQMSYYGNATTDLCYLLYTSTTKSYRDEHLQDLLKTYYSIFTATLESFCASKEILSFQAFEEDFQKVGHKTFLVHRP